MPQSLQDSLHTAFSKLKRDQEDNPDWHPNTNGMVQDLVHPSMYPLVYGRSRGFKEEVVGVDDAIEKWMGKGEVIPKENRLVDDDPFGVRYGIGGGMAPPEYWSDTYQWLPANVAFQDDGTVKFTSYINNLHPKKYPDIYRTIEKLIQTALPLWDQCLKTIHGDGAAGRTASRFPFPHDAE